MEYNPYNEAKKLKKDEEWEIFKQVYELRQKLENKRGKEFSKIVTVVLTNFEELYENEWRLQQQIKQKELVTEKREEINTTRKLIEENIKKVNINITNYIENIKTEQGHVFIGNQIGNNTNLQITANINYTTKLEEVIDEEESGPNKNITIKKTNLNWVNINTAFTNQGLVQQWTEQSFTYEQVRQLTQEFKEWFEPNNLDFYLWLREIKELNDKDLQTYIEQPPK